MNPLDYFKEGRNPRQFDDASLEAVVQSSQYQELNPLSARHMQGSIAANDSPQLTQEQGGELTPDEIKKKRRNEQRKESRDRGKKMKEALEREFTVLKDQVETQMEETASVKQQNASLVQATESQEKTVKKLKKRAAKWKLEYQKEHDRAEYLQNQMPSLISKLIDDKFNHLFKLLGAASASDVDQALYAQAIPSRQQNVAASHAQMNSPMVGMSNTDPFQPNSQSGALPSSMQQSPANMEGSFQPN